MLKKNILIYIVTILSVPCIGTAAQAAETRNFTYDAKGRMIKVTKSGTATGSVTVDYEFDKADNRTRSKTETGAS